MYGGIITRSGKIIVNEGDNNGYQLKVETDVAQIVNKGDSVGINGVCLTVKNFDKTSVSFDVWPETLKRTTLQSLFPGTEVHVDLPLKYGDFIGGHNILGHVDYVAETLEVTSVQDTNQVKIWFSLPAQFEGLIPIRGSVAVDGVSLTVTDRTKESFSVSLIPETLSRTHLIKLKKGKLVNIEVDFNARHIQDSSGILSLSIPDSCRAPRTDDLNWAYETLKAGGAVVVVDENGIDTECAIIASTEKITAEVLTFSLGMARVGCTIAVDGYIAERLAIPAPTINRPIDEEARRYMIPINHLENSENDYTAAALLKTISLFHDRSKGIGDWRCPGNVSSIQIYNDEVSRRHGVLEAAVKLVKNAKLNPSALCLTLHNAQGKRFSSEQAEAFSSRFELPLVKIKNLS